MKNMATMCVNKAGIPLIVLFCLVGQITASAQQSTSIGTTTIKSNAVLYLYSEGKNQGLIIPVVSSKDAVSNPDEGMMVYDESDHKLYYRNDAGWAEVGVSSTGSTSGGSGGGSTGGGSTGGTINLGGDLTGSPNAAVIQRIQGKNLSASNPSNGQILKYNATTQTWELSIDAGSVYSAGTGITINAGNQISIASNGVTTTQIASNTITDSDLNKASIPLSGFGTASANLDLGNQKVINLGTPTSNADATTKAYVDAADASMKTYVDAADATKINTSILTTGGDLLEHNGTAVTRLPRGTSGQVLFSNPTGIQWGTLPSSFPNPMTTPGDIIVGGASGVAQRLGGSAGFLKSTGASLPAWSAVNVGSSDVTGVLPITNGGTGANAAAGARTNLGLGTLATLNSASLTTNVTGVLPIGNGGTGANAAAGARTNLGLGSLSTLNSADLTTNVTGILPISNGGTGASSVAGTWTNLGLGSMAGLNSADLTTNVTGILPVTNGGTGANAAPAARTNLGLGTLATLNSANLSSNVTGTLPVGNGGTGATSAAAARTNLGLGSLATLSTVTSSEISDGTIVNADISTTAAIAGTKISPNFGSQDINTTGNGNIGAMSMSAGNTDNTGAAKVFFDLGARGQDGIQIKSTSAWGTSLHISNGSSTSTSAGYTLAVTGSSGPTGHAGDFAIITGLLPAFTINTSTDVVDIPSTFSLSVGRSSALTYPFEVEGNAGKTAGGSSWQTVSDFRLKKDISPFTDGLNVIRSINPIWFKYNGKGGIRASKNFEVGIIAQEMKKIAPYTVSSFKAKFDESSPEKEEFLDFNFSALNYALINSVKELDQRVKELENENSQLKQQLQDTIPKGPPDHTNESELKAALEIQKQRTDQLESEMKELKKLIYIEAKGTDSKKE